MKDMEDITGGLLEKIRGLGGTPVTITPFSTESTRLNLLDGPVNTVLETLEVLNGEPLTVPERTLAEVAILQEQQQGELSLRSLQKRLDTATAIITELIILYRTVYQPLREGSLVRAILLTFAPELDEKQVNVSESAPLDAPLNPWFLLREGNEAAAINRLCQELAWPDTFAPYALTLLKELA